MADLNGAVQYAQQSDPMMGLTPEQSAAYLEYLANNMGGGANLAPPLARINSERFFGDPSIPAMQPHPGFGAPSYGEGQVIPHEVPTAIDESMVINPAISSQRMVIDPATDRLKSLYGPGHTADRMGLGERPPWFDYHSPPRDASPDAFFRDVNLRQPQTNADTVYTENQEPLAYRIYKAQHPETVSDSPFQKVIFGGEKGAANAPPGAGPGMPVEAAKKLEQSGANSRDIFLKTGWYHAPDGQWKWTLSDKNADLNKDAFLTYTTGGTGGSGGPTSGEKEEVALKPGGPRKLPDVLNHPTLYQTYPHLKNATVDRLPTVESQRTGALADYNPNTNTVRFVDGRPKEEVVGSLLHELQHGVQGFEGFGQGGGLELFYPVEVQLGMRPPTKEDFDKARESYSRLAGETESRQVERQYYTKDWNQAPTRLEGFPAAEKQIVRHDGSNFYEPGKSYVPPGKPSPVRRPVSLGEFYHEGR